MLSVGDKVSDFTLPLAFADGRKDDVAFSSLLGRGPLVLSFFPLAFTRTCTTQMCDARDNAAVFEQAGAQYYGFSCDAAPSNVAFARQEALAHGIFSDANRSIVEHLWKTWTVLGVERVPRRGWMVVDARGVVSALRLVEPGTPWSGSDDILAAIAEAR